MSSSAPDLILYNANVLTMDPASPRAFSVAVRGSDIVAVGREDFRQKFRRPHPTLIDCQGGTLVPGFHDAHCHILATAASLLAVDCGPSAAPSIQDIQARLKERSAQLTLGIWIKGVGYNEFYLKEKRHPSRWDLDRAAPEHPVRLLHSSGHAAVLNSPALALAGIHKDTPDPPYGVIERDGDTGEPTGLLLEMNEYLENVIPPLSPKDVEQGIMSFNEQCLSLGITSLQDAAAANSLERWALTARLKANRLLTPSVTFMAGAGRVRDFLREGLVFGYGENGLRLGAAKIMLTMTTGALQPPREELHQLVAEAHGSGFQVAIHAVEAEAVEAAVETLERIVQADSRSHLRHRIEHCSECPPSLVNRLARNRITIVTQPAFVYFSGGRYLSQVPGDRLPWLYPIRSLKDAGVPLAAGSDAPVIPLNPLVGIYAAVTRRSESGDVVLPHQGIGAQEALEMYTLGSAYASFEERIRGSIEVGKKADLVLLETDPTAVDSEEIKGIRVLMTIAQGCVVWER